MNAFRISLLLGDRLLSVLQQMATPECNRTERTTVERGSGRLKQWCGIASHSDKHAITYLGGITLAAIVLNHRIRI